MQNSTFYIRDMPPDLKKRLRIVAANQEETMNTIILRAIEYYVRECERKIK